MIKEEYIFKKDKRTKEDLIKQFKELNQDEKSSILIMYFGTKPLFEEMIKEDLGIKHLRELIKEGLKENGK